MENYEIIDQKIKNMPEYKIITKKSNIAGPVVLSVIGVGMLIAGAIGLFTKSLNITFILVGIAILALGIILIVSNLNKEIFIYQPTGKKMRKHKIYLNHNNMQKLSHCLDHNQFKSLSHIEKEMNANKMLVIMVPDDGAIAVAQTFEYIPYHYEPTSPVYIIVEQGAKELLNFCKA